MRRENLSVLDMDGIKRDFAHALRARCSENRCTLGLAGLRERVILKGDDIHQDRKMCDCIVSIVDDSIIVGIVELKSKTVHASEIMDKLANSSEVALKIIEKYAANHIKPEFHHLVLSLSQPRGIELKKIKKGIRVRGKKHEIISRRCGTSFSDVISK